MPTPPKLREPFAPLFSTDPHDGQTLGELTAQNDPAEPVGNRLFTLTDGRNMLALTGEELTSLARQWLAASHESP